MIWLTSLFDNDISYVEIFLHDFSINSEADARMFVGSTWTVILSAGSKFNCTTRGKNS